LNIWGGETFISKVPGMKNAKKQRKAEALQGQLSTAGEILRCVRSAFLAITSTKHTIVANRIRICDAANFSQVS